MTNFWVYDIILCLAHGESAIPRRGYEQKALFLFHDFRFPGPGRRQLFLRGQARAGARADGRGCAPGADGLRPVAGDGQVGDGVPQRDRQAGECRKRHPDHRRNPDRIRRPDHREGGTGIPVLLGKRQVRAHQHGGAQDRGSGDPRGLVLEGRNPLLSKREAGLRQDRTAGWVLAREICQPDRHPTAGPELGGSQRT